MVCNIKHSFVMVKLNWGEIFHKCDWVKMALGLNNVKNIFLLLCIYAPWLITVRVSWCEGVSKLIPKESIKASGKSLKLF